MASRPRRDRRPDGPTSRSGRRADGPGGRRPVDFTTAVSAVLAGLGPGEVVTYGEVAAEAGFPGAARAVGGVLAASGGRFAWWRVVAASGRLAPGKEAEQARRLTAEGVEVSDGRVRGRDGAGSATRRLRP